MYLDKNMYLLYLPIHNKNEFLYFLFYLDLIDKGYNIYLHKNDKVFKLKPGMILNGKKIRKEHNLLKM